MYLSFVQIMDEKHLASELGFILETWLNDKNYLRIFSVCSVCKPFSAQTVLREVFLRDNKQERQLVFLRPFFVRG